jgi:CRISPR-associated endonuclease/helicase Cas3
MKFAHSTEDDSKQDWELLARHLIRVGGRAREFAAPFGWQSVAQVVGQLHDIGKISSAFQVYLTQRDQPARRGPDHSTAGAREAVRLYPGLLGRLMAFCIAGHHAGLPDAKDLDRRLVMNHPIEPYDGWQDYAGDLPSAATLAPTVHSKGPSPHVGFSKAFLTRMLFSCLVDADFLETEQFYARTRNEPVERSNFADIGELRARLLSFMRDMRSRDPEKSINALRNRVLDHAVAKAADELGLFRLTVPTGGGKTLASLTFALEHAAHHGLRRVVYVIPFTSIIEQTADVFRKALGEDDVLEHHAAFDWGLAANGAKESVAEADSEGGDGLRKLQKASENWEAPIVVTTAVQFFESLYASRTSRCRKLHNLAKAVIVLDEAQMIPIPVLLPCLAALDELQRNYGASVVLCTATQPAFRIQDGVLPQQKRGAVLGLDIPDSRELAPEPERLYREVKRVAVEVRRGPTSDADLVAAFAQQTDGQMLCIVNTREHARRLFDAISGQEGIRHLSTLMCPRHRRMVLEDVRVRLKAGQPVRLVSTSLIEAGVDVDFPEVWRAVAGLDQIAQAAGRCNREGRLASGRVVVFEPAEAKLPREIEAFWQACRAVKDRFADDLLGLDAVKAYFKELYWQKGVDALDKTEVEEGVHGVLKAIAERSRDFTFPFKSIAEAFRLIDDVMEPVIVPWRSHRGDTDADDLLAATARSERPRRDQLRKLQQYTVSIPKRNWCDWVECGALRPVHPALETLLRFEDDSHYRQETGLDLISPEQRAVEMNII